MNQWKRAIETWFTGKEEQMVRQIADLVAVPSVGGESAGHASPSGKAQPKRWRSLCSKPRPLA